MFIDSRRRYIEQFRHLFLGQPKGFFFEEDFDRSLAFWHTIQEYFKLLHSNLIICTNVVNQFVSLLILLGTIKWQNLSTSWSSGWARMGAQRSIISHERGSGWRVLIGLHP